LTIGSIVLTSVKRLGVRWKITGTISNKTKNCLIDAIRIGTGITINAGVGRNPGTFSDILSTVSSSTNAWGIITSISGIYYVVGKMVFGSTNQSVESIFEEVNKTIVFKNYPVSPSLYEIKVIGAWGQKTNFKLGRYDPLLLYASNGCVVKGAGSGASHAV